MHLEESMILTSKPNLEITNQPLTGQLAAALEHIKADHEILQRVYRMHQQETWQTFDRETGRYGSEGSGYCAEDGFIYPCPTIKCFEEGL
jgi:hypothetical protein